MKARGLVRLGITVATAAWMLAAVPGLVAAQPGPSGQVQLPTVSPSQLPRSGDWAADQAGMLATALTGASAVIAGVALRARSRHETGRRRRQ
jgi:hypothetical protein